MIAYKMHLIRTGKTSAGQGKKYVGQLDAPLCADGIEELYALRREFEYPKAEIVFTSPLSRCVETADILYPDVFTQEISGFMDMNLGEFEGKTFEELRTDENFSRWIRNSYENTPPKGEEITEFTERIISAAGEVFGRMMDEKITNAAVITHGGVIMTLLAAIGLPKLPINDWVTPNGMGYTLLLTPQMWMRDGSAEVFSRQPQPKPDDDSEYDDEY